MKIEELALLLHAEKKGEFFFGERNGYPFTLRFTRRGYYDMPVFTFVFDQTINQQTIRTIRYSIKGAQFVLEQSTDSSALSVIYQNVVGKSDKVQQKIVTFLDELIEKFVSISLKPRTLCYFCGKEIDEKAGGMDQFQHIHAPMHSECKEMVIAKVREQYDAQSQNNKFVPRSILFSTLGALLGVLIIWIIALVSNYFIGIAFAAIPVLAFYGYKLGKAPLKMYTRFLVIGISLISTVGGLFAIYATLAAIENIDFIAYISEPDTGFLQNLLLNIVFLALGVLIAWRTISRTLEKPTF